MEKIPESSNEKTIEALRNLEDFETCLSVVENSAHFVDLNRKTEEKVEVKEGLELTHTILQSDKLREMQRKLKESLEYLPEQYKNNAEGLLLKASLYLAAQDREKELARKNLVLLRPTKPMTSEEVLKEIESQGFRAVTMEEFMKLMDYSKESIDEAKLKLEKSGWKPWKPEDNKKGE
ncbi:MAG: hypothetical protein WCT19_02195 [Candidatus Paceibacterota bacterium]